jgi:hypothetical protein
MRSSALLHGVVLLAGLAGAGLPAACGSDSDSKADAGPGDEPDAGDPNALDCEGRSGPRIRQIMRNHSDGSKEPLRLFDLDLAEECSYGLAADSSLRCIPIADGAPFATGTIMYSDPGCTARIAELAAPIGDPAPTYMQQVVSGGSADGCAPVTRNYQLGNALAVTPGTTTVYRQDPDNCVGVTAGSNPYYEVAAELMPEDLVTATESWVGEGRVQARRLEGEDGSRACDLASFRDLELETSCQLRYGEDNSIQCLPSPLAVGSYFSDGACGAGTELPLMVVPGQCDSGARYAQETALAACNYRQRVRALGAEYADPYFKMDGTCMQVTPATGDVAYRVGPAISGSSFSSFVHSFMPSGGDRLERGDLENGVGLRVRSSAAFGEVWRDTMFETPCSFEAAADDMTRCLPSGSSQTPVATVVSRFSDVGCATPVTVGEVNLTCYGSAEPTYARDGVHVYPVTGAAPATYRMDATCVQITDVAVFSIGAELTPEMFVSGEEMRE